MDETSLRALLEQAVADEPPAGPIVASSVAAGLRLRRRRRVRAAAAFASLAAVIVAVGVTVPGLRTGSRPKPASTSASGARAQFAGVSFVLPEGWVLGSSGQTGRACAQPAHPPAGAPSWAGCAGVWVEPWTTDPSRASAGLGPGSVWYFSTGVLGCPYSSSQPGNEVLTPGMLTDHGSQSHGTVSYRWYQWSATCNLNGVPGAPVTDRFNPQVWWLPAPGVAFVDATGHPQTISILASVRPATATALTTGPYGFLIPAGARTVLPLTSYGGPASWAKITDAGSGAVLAYKVSGGELGQAYLPDHAPDPAGLLGAPTSGPVAYLAPCTVVTHAAVTANALTYTCAPATPGMITQGKIVVEPYAQGYKILQVTLPASQATQLQAILNSLTP